MEARVRAGRKNAGDLRVAFVARLVADERGPFNHRGHHHGTLQGRAGNQDRGEKDREQQTEDDHSAAIRLHSAHSGPAWISTDQALGWFWSRERTDEDCRSSGDVFKPIQENTRQSAASDGRDFSKRFFLSIEVRVTTGGFVPGAGLYCWLRERGALPNGVAASSAAGMR
jgi:hypothetical protein